MNKTWVDIAVPSGPCEPSTLRPRRSVLGMDLHRIGAKPCPEGRDQDRGWSVSAGDVSPGQTRPMPSDCYACQQAGPEAPLRERRSEERRVGKRVGVDTGGRRSIKKKKEENKKKRRRRKRKD